MSITSYAQNFEDVLLWRALHDAEPKTYLDIGAQDPTIDSISLAFYEQGWRGTHVEPTPQYAAKLREARPDETIIEAAVSCAPGPIEFHEIPDTGLSTGLHDIARKHVEQGFQTRTILVPALRLDNLLERTGEIPWMKIDVEGMEADVLASWGDSTIRPWVLIVEATYPNTQDPSDHEWRELVVSRGYQEVYCDGLSRYFVHEAHADLKSRFWLPPNIFDGFQVTGNHFSNVLYSHDKTDEAAELEAQISSLRQQLTSSESAFEAERSARSTVENRLQELDGELASSRHEHAAAREALAEAERNHNAAIEQLQTRSSETERGLTQALSALEAELRAGRAELKVLRDREGEHLNRIDALSSDKQETEKRLRHQIESLNRHIQVALDQPVGRWQRLGRAIGFADDDLTRQALRTWQPQYSVLTSPSVETSMSSAPDPGRNPYLRANSLAELLSWQDVDFVRCAYVTILGRQSDPTGEEHYVSQLRRGRSKLEVLWQLRKSDEGPNHDPGIAGLDRALKRARWQRLNPFRPTNVKSANGSAETHRDEMISISEKLDDMNAALAARLDQMHASMRFLEGHALRSSDATPEATPQIELDAFKRNLRMVAKKLESEAE